MLLVGRDFRIENLVIYIIKRVKKMKYSKKVFLSASLLVASVTASAAIVEIGDFGQLRTDPTGLTSYVFTGVLSAENPIYTWEMFLEPNTSININIAAVPGVDLLAAVHSEADFGGEILANPGFINLVPAGGWNFLFDSQTWRQSSWMSLEILNSSSFFANGGTVVISSITAGSENVIVDPNPGGGGGGNPIVVSAPASFGIFLLGILVFVWRKTRGNPLVENRKTA